MRTKAGRIARFGALSVICLALADCSSSDKLSRKVDPKYGVATSPRVVEFGKPVPKGGGTYRVGKPYTVAGRVYVPEENLSYRAEGIASWYGRDFHGRLTANGEVYDMETLTAAHPTLPLPSYVRVTNIGNSRSIIVRVNDRGPYHGNRVIDLSTKTAQLLGFHGSGLARVRVEYVGRASLDGSDDRRLEATLRQGEPAPAPSSVRVASSRPFAPESRNTGAMRGAPPMPPERPFTLGEPQPAGSDRSPLVETTSIARPSSRALASVESAPMPLPRMTPERSAYAPARAFNGRNDMPASILTGRGLY